MSRHTLADFPDLLDEDLVRGRRGWAGPTWTDLRVLLALHDRFRPRRCLEIGVHEGHTASLLLGHSGCIERYVGLDCVPRDRSRIAPIIAGKHAYRDPRFTALAVPGGTHGLQPCAVPGGPFDWIFIDSDHSYRGACFDTEWAEELAAPRCLLVWHDYGVPSQFQPCGPVFGVKQFLDERARRTWKPTQLETFADPLHSSSLAWEALGATRP